jgi:superfamily II DNA or RNA helicase
MAQAGTIRLSVAGKRKPGKKSTKTVQKKTPRHRKPVEMDLEDWQVALRREFGREQDFKIKNVGDDPVFSEFLVSNPKTQGDYRVAIRGTGLGDNYCSCPDFAVNALGTCKHIEFTLGRLERRRGGKAALAKGHTPHYAEIYLRYGAQRDVVFQSGENGPKSLLGSASRYFDKQGVLQPLGYRRFDTIMNQIEAKGRELRCYDDAKAYIAQVRDQVLLKQRIEKLFPNGGRGPEFKKLLKVSLYPYQRKGALFAALAGRCLLADDMGLGKTIQAIMTAEILAKTMGLERVLIVSPTSLKYQWKQEIEKFSHRDAEVVEGSLAKRMACYEGDSFFKITNYDVIHRDVDAIGRWAPEMVILDEAQRIKNWKTRTAQSVKKLDSKYALVLTGTPLENRLEELHSIVEFVDRFRLGPLFRFLHEHQHVDDEGRVVGYKNLGQIGKTLESILLRRNKETVLKDLPERLEKNYMVPMTEQQMRHHEDNREAVSRIVAKWRSMGFLTDTDQRRLMAALQNMRMSCNSTYLLDKKTDYGVKADELKVVLDELFERPDAKAVIFSQWLGTHELIQERIAKTRWNHVMFHGGVPSKKRKDLIAQFKEDDGCRIFLSTDAGGVGLNLQNASAVVNMDLPWNPAVLDQRIGRVHRLGQHRSVRVINFVAQGTIEHGMLSVLSFKKSLFAGALEKGADEVFLGGSRLKRFMESVEKATDSIPQPMPQSINEVNDPVPDSGSEQSPAGTGQQQAWNEILAAGLSFMDKLGKSLGKDNNLSKSARRASGEIAIEKDKTTGQTHLKLPVPPKETLQKVAQLLQDLSKNL